MKHLAITGNMGSGKSTVSSIFENMGIPVYYSDVHAKRLMNEDKEVREQLIAIFGKDVYGGNELLNRTFLGKKIFHDKSLLTRVNKIVHPRVRKDYLKWRKKQNAQYTLQESALTFEIKADKIMDATILVYAPEPLLINRIKQRDNLSIKDIKARLDKQISQDKKKEKASFIINNGISNVLTRQIQHIHLQIIN